MDEPAPNLACAFEKAIVTRTCGCRYATRHNLNARQTISCQTKEGHKLCSKLLNQIRKSASFALGATHVPSALPHAKALQVQCGGLKGLKTALDGAEQNERVGDIYSLVKRAVRRFSSMHVLPEQEIVRSIASFGK